MLINFSQDSVIMTTYDGGDDDADDVMLPSPVTFTNEVDQYLPGFFVVQHCFCYQDDGGVVTEAEVISMKYSPHNAL